MVPKGKNVGNGLVDFLSEAFGVNEGAEAFHNGLPTWLASRHRLLAGGLRSCQVYSLKGSLAASSLWMSDLSDQDGSQSILCDQASEVTHCYSYNSLLRTWDQREIVSHRVRWETLRALLRLANMVSTEFILTMGSFILYFTLNYSYAYSLLE